MHTHTCTCIYVHMYAHFCLGPCLQWVHTGSRIPALGSTLPSCLCHPWWARVVSLRTVAVALGDRGAPRHTSALARCKVRLPLFLDSKVFVSRILALPSPKALCSVPRVSLRLQLLRPACALGHADVELPAFASWAAFPSSELRGNREAAPPLTPRSSREVTGRESL